MAKRTYTLLMLLLAAVSCFAAEPLTGNAFFDDASDAVPVKSADGYQAPKMVDLGLSVKWAECNLGALSSLEPGDYFAWGETVKKPIYGFTSFHYLNGRGRENLLASLTELTKQVPETSSYKMLHRLNSGNDACMVNLGGGWRMPTSAEWEELRKRCTFKTQKDGDKRYIRATGPNGNSIVFIIGPVCLPNKKDNGSSRGSKSTGIYWSSDLRDGKTLSFIMTDFGRYTLASTNPWNGCQIRPVYDSSLAATNNSVNPVSPVEPANNSSAAITPASTAKHANNTSATLTPVSPAKPSNSTIAQATPAAKNDKLTVAWVGLPEETTTKTMKLKIGIKSPSAVKATALFVNGQLTRGIKAVNNDGYDLVLTPTVTFAEGINTLRLEVVNGGGKTVEEMLVIYYPESKSMASNKPVPVMEKRVALVVGNSNYPGAELANPTNDARALAGKLRSLGFDVMLVTDAGKRQLEDKISEFAQRASKCDVAMFFFAGHGIQYNGINYLIPTDAVLRSARDVEYETTDVSRVLANLEDSGCKVNILALDACRNNPFERKWVTRGTQSRSRGLSAINAPIGSFISYATAPGNVASDGNTRNSPYTTALLDALDVPGLTIENLFKRVGAEVSRSTGKAQTPWYSSSLFEGDFYFNLPR